MLLHPFSSVCICRSDCLFDMSLFFSYVKHHTQLFISYVEISYVIALFFICGNFMSLFFSYVEISYVIAYFTYENSICEMVPNSHM